MAHLKSELAASNPESYELLQKEILPMYELVDFLKHEVERDARHLYRDKRK